MTTLEPLWDSGQVSLLLVVLSSCYIALICFNHRLESHKWWLDVTTEQKKDEICHTPPAYAQQPSIEKRASDFPAEAAAFIGFFWFFESMNQKKHALKPTNFRVCACYRQWLVPVCCRLLAHSSVSEGSARFIAFGLRARDARLRAPSPFDRCSVAIRTRRAGMWWTGLCDQFSTTPVRNSAFLLQTASFPTLETSLWSHLNLDPKSLYQ